MQLEPRDFEKLSISTSGMLIQTIKHVKYFFLQLSKEKGKVSLTPNTVLKYKFTIAKENKNVSSLYINHLFKITIFIFSR
jgi:hypothetical protein